MGLEKHPPPGLAGHLPLLRLAHLFTLPYWPLLSARPVAQQPLPPPRGLAVGPGSRHAPRLPEVAFGSLLSRRAGVGSVPRSVERGRLVIATCH